MSLGLFKDNVQVITSSSTINYYRLLYNDGELFLDAVYQRSYVWTTEQQQALLSSIFKAVPLGGIALSLNPHGPKTYYCEIVDGKQRLTTIILFVCNKIPYVHNGKAFFWDDLSKPAQRKFRAVHLPFYELRRYDATPLTLTDKLNYFYRVNFGGTPQSDEHRLKVLDLLTTSMMLDGDD